MLSYNSLTYVQDMKIGHYSKTPLDSGVEAHALHLVTSYLMANF